MDLSEFFITVLQVIIAIIVAAFALGMFFMVISFGVTMIRGAFRKEFPRKIPRDD